MHQTILGLTNSKHYWFYSLLVLGILLIIVSLYKRYDFSKFHEGFDQGHRFVLKQNSEIYDDFYANIYDRLMLPEKRVQFEIDQIIQMTEPNPKFSAILDIGSGTGELVNRLQKKGFDVYGIDLSQDMVDHSLKKNPDLKITCGDANSSMAFENGTFTHVLCLGLTIYQFPDKRQFFQNCYSWLKSGGYLVIHLVDRDHFDTIIPAGKPPLVDSPQKHSKQRITDTIIDFIDFHYKSVFQFKDSDKTAILKETFTDGITKNVRQNELVLYMENVNDVLRIASAVGFLVKGQVNMLHAVGDDYQYIIVLERPQ